MKVRTSVKRICEKCKKEVKLSVEERKRVEEIIARMPEKVKRETEKRELKFFVGSGQYFVVGDNRRNSVDSRFYGPILRSKIIGKVIEFKND